MYQALALYDLDSNFIGYTIGKTTEGVLKLHTTNVWAFEDSDDLTGQLARLNDQTDVKAYWPDVRDPEVQAYLDDSHWEPVQLIPVEIPDDERSIYIYREEPRPEDGFPGVPDMDLSEIVMKTAMVPSPADNMRRVKKACEIVARQRAAIALQ